MKKGKGKTTNKKSFSKKSNVSTKTSKSAQSVAKSSTKIKKPKKTVVFVCSGNTCRSPMGEYIFADYCKKNGLSAKIYSAGLCTIDGMDMMEQAKEALSNLGISHDERHKSKRISNEDLSADLLICMTKAQKDIIDYDNVKTIGELTGHKDVDDPYGLGVEVYEKIAKYLQYACEDIAKYLWERDKISENENNSNKDEKSDDSKSQK